jgi:uncharacterized cupin superfamily protein
VTPGGHERLRQVERFNIFDGELKDTSDEDPEGFKGAFARFGPQLGAEQLGITLYELPPGQAICPYHYEAGEEEFLIVLSGRASVRHTGGTDVLGPGDTVCFPEGPAGAHKVSNESGEPIRVLMFSTVTYPAVAVYPDSDKVGVFTRGEEPLRLLFRRPEAVDYYDGETGSS